MNMWTLWTYIREMSKNSVSIVIFYSMVELGVDKEDAAYSLIFFNRYLYLRLEL